MRKEILHLNAELWEMQIYVESQLSNANKTDKWSDEQKCWIVRKRVEDRGGEKQIANVMDWKSMTPFVLFSLAMFLKGGKGEFAKGITSRGKTERVSF